MAISKAKKRGSKRKGKNVVPTGSCISVVTDVVPAEGYEKGDAYVVIRELTYETGMKYSYKELFLNDLENDRCKELDNYLTKNNVTVESFEDLVGLREELTLMKQVRGGRTFINITEREFISWGDA